jgi:N-acetylglucosaminyl-diphospho-decaprenol L-rhamnosyltransferase
VVGPALDAIAAELRDGDELIVVDNGSTDGTPGAVRESAPRARLVEAGENLGFAAGSNRGAAISSSELLLFLNPDAVVAPGFRESIERPLTDGRGWAAWQGLVTADGGRTINSRGGDVHFTGIAWAGGAGQTMTDAGDVDAAEPGFVSGACLAIPARDFEGLGGFAEEFFLYHEDVDLSLRLRLAGGRLGVERAARVDHDYEFEKGAGKWRLLERNRWATLIRTYPAGLLGLLMPALLGTELALVPISIAGGWFAQKLASWYDVIRWLPRLRRERRTIQATRRVTPAAFARGLTADLDSAYLGAAGRSRVIRALLRAYWSAVVALLPGSARRG